MSSTPSQPIVYTAFRTLFRVITHLFFREIQTTGDHLVPRSGPCIFIVGPHANQFVDGMVFMSKNPRPSYVLMASVSYHRPIIGHVGKILHAIPVVRPQDIANKGTGTVTYDGQTTIHGKGNTCFTKEIAPRDFIQFGPYKGHVRRVLSDTCLELSHPIPNFSAPTTAGYPFKIVPHIDQTPVYHQVHAYLANNECITIFPEGGSHDRPEMLPLKAGFAVMALGAVAEHPDLKDLKIVPVGLNYFHPDRFRSRAVVCFGQPIQIEPEQVEKFKMGGQPRREAVTELLDKSDEALRTVTMNAPDDDTLTVIQAARRLYQGQQKSLSIQQVVQLNRHFVVGWTKLLKNGSDPRLEALTRKIKLYNETLSFFGIRDHQVDKLNITPMHAAWLLVKRLSTLSVLVGLGAPALVSNLPLIWATDYISKKKQKEALAGSMVKITGKDVLATWKILVAAFAAPALYGFYALLYLSYLVQRKPKLSKRSKVARATAVWLIQPILHYFLMRLGDVGWDIYNSIKPLFLAIRNPKVGKILRVMRQDLSKDIMLLLQEHADVFMPEGTKHTTSHSSSMRLPHKSF